MFTTELSAADEHGRAKRSYDIEIRLDRKSLYKKSYCKDYVLWPPSHKRHDVLPPVAHPAVEEFITDLKECIANDYYEKASSADIITIGILADWLLSMGIKLSPRVGLPTSHKWRHDLSAQWSCQWAEGE